MAVTNKSSSAVSVSKFSAKPVASKGLFANKKALTVIGSVVAMILLGIAGGVVYYYVTYGELPTMTDSSAGLKSPCSKAQLNKGCKVSGKKCDCGTSGSTGGSAESRCKSTKTTDYYWCTSKPGETSVCKVNIYSAKCLVLDPTSLCDSCITDKLLKSETKSSTASTTATLANKCTGEIVIRTNCVNDGFCSKDANRTGYDCKKVSQ